jgi:hypothetical protein
MIPDRRPSPVMGHVPEPWVTQDQFIFLHAPKVLFYYAVKIELLGHKRDGRSSNGFEASDEL